MHKNTSFTPNLTYTIIFLTIIAFFLSSYLNFLGNGASIPELQNHNYAVIFWAILSHQNIIHLSLNMLALYQIGPLLESRVSKQKWLSVYLFSGIFGVLLSLSVGYIFNNNVGTLGASGAILGLVGGLLGDVYINANHSQFKSYLNWLAPSLLLTLMLGFLIPNIDQSGHIGGFLMGFLCGLYKLDSHKTNESLQNANASTMLVHFKKRRKNISRGALFLIFLLFIIVLQVLSHTNHSELTDVVSLNSQSTNSQETANNFYVDDKNVQNINANITNIDENVIKNLNKALQDKNANKVIAILNQSKLFYLKENKSTVPINKGLINQELNLLANISKDNITNNLNNIWESAASKAIRPGDSSALERAFSIILQNSPPIQNNIHPLEANQKLSDSVCRAISAPFLKEEKATEDYLPKASVMLRNEKNKFVNEFKPELLNDCAWFFTDMAKENLLDHKLALRIANQAYQSLSYFNTANKIELLTSGELNLDDLKKYTLFSSTLGSSILHTYVYALKNNHFNDEALHLLEMFRVLNNGFNEYILLEKEYILLRQEKMISEKQLLEFKK